MSETETPLRQEYEFKAEMKQLLHLIIHSLYTHPEVFLRELISNSSDALNKVRFMQVTNQQVVDPDAPLKLTISIDSKEQTFTIEDTGIGMTKEDLVERIGTVASSGTLDFFKNVAAENKAIKDDLIGKFGVGFYSAFMVTDEITIETRHADPDSKAYRWQSKGEGAFTIEEIDRPERGTRITFKLKDEHKEFSEDYRVKSIIKKYSNFVDFPIFIGEEQVNTVTALWHRSKENITDEELNEFYKFISNDYKTPLGHLLLNIEGRYNFRALVFIPEMAPLRFMDMQNEKSLHLYANKVFIQDDCKELLPEYMYFLKGVVDTEDLPLNVSREVTQSSPVTTKIREVITGRVLSFLEDWAKSDTEKYDKFFAQFGRYMKIGCNNDYANKERLVELLRFETTKTEKDKTASFKDYVSRMKDDQTEIYYLTGDNRDVIEHNPNLEYFRKNDIEVLLLPDPVDVFTFPYITEYDKKPLVSIEKSDIKFDEKKDAGEPKVEKTQATSLLAKFKGILGDAVEDVVESKRLVDSASTLVVGKEGMDVQMERMMKMMNKDYAGSKKILELNLNHPLIANLSTLNETGKDNVLLEKCIHQIYEGALLVDENLDNRISFVQRMTELMEKATNS